MKREELLDRAERVIRSCETVEQLKVARRYVDLAVEKALPKKGSRVRNRYIIKFMEMIYARREHISDPKYGVLLKDTEGNP